MSRIEIPNKDFKIAAVINFPPDFDEKKKYPALVVGHPASGCKEQTSGVYAKEIAKAGYIAVAYDASYQGESGGLPRFQEVVDERVNDFSAVIDYLETLPYVDTDKIGLVGICASGAYSLKATIRDRRVKALATISPAEIGRPFSRGWDGKGKTSDALPTMEASSNDRSAIAKGAEPTIVPFLLPPDQAPHPELKDGWDYYRTPRAQHKNSPNKLYLATLSNVFDYDAFANVEDLLTQPALFVFGEDAATRWIFEEQLPRFKNKYETVYIPGANHFDLYDRKVPEVVPHVVKFLDANLKA